MTGRTAMWERPVLSPRGDRIAVGIRDEEDSDIWILDIERDTLLRLTNDGTSRRPVWSPDGGWVAFQSSGDIYRKRSDLTGPVERLVELPSAQSPHGWSSDGRWIAFLHGTGDGYDIWAFTPGEEPRPVVQDPGIQTNVSLSPDGSC